MIDWREDGAAVKQSISEKYPYLGGNVGILIRDEELYGLEGLTYTDFASGCMSSRYMTNALFSDQGPGVFTSSSSSLGQMVAGLNSRITSYFLRALSPSPLHLRKAYVYETPCPNAKAVLGDYCIELTERKTGCLV